MEPTRVLYFSDLLCIWAYVSQVRIDELGQALGAEVRVEHRFCPVFGDARERLERRWADRGGLGGYGAHVLEVALRFPHVEVHEAIWRQNAPSSSLSAHIFLSAVRLVAEREDREGLFEAVSWGLRKAFFAGLEDVGRRDVQLAVALEHGLEPDALEELIDSGRAHAELSRDYELARDYSVTVSPTIILNEGRQRLLGNVGYRVIEANVRELRRDPALERFSWC